MLKLELNAIELFDESKNEFIDCEAATLELEHSLVSLSKWESKFEVPFLTDREKTHEETLSYVECMVIGNTPENLRARLNNEHFAAINSYISAKMTATWFNENPNQRKSREIITSEVIYYWLVALNIPFECESWHLNRLLTLVKVVNQKTQDAQNHGKKKPFTKSDLQSRRALNQARRQQLGTTG